MNKKLEIFFKELGLEIEGNKANGIYKNYELSAITWTFNAQFPLSIHLSFFANDEIKRSITNELRDLKLKYFKYSVDSYGLTFGLNDLTIGKLVQNLPNKLEQILDVLNKNQVLGAG